VNGSAILPPLNPRADCVSYPPVLHRLNLALNWDTRKGRRIGGKVTHEGRDAANIAKLPDLLRKD
jgi:hypothetical protein